MSNQAAAPAAPGMPGAPAAGFRPASVALCTFGLALASFMQVLDTTIANVSLPTIAGNLGASSQQATWVITSFAVSNAIALPLTGFLSRRFGETKLFVWATLAFTMASLLCGLAQSMGMLVVSRALQGFVCGPMYPITQSLLVSVYPREKRGHALALLAMITVVAPIAGPILGGWITDNYSWEWIFFINVPLGILAATVVGGQLRDRPEPVERPRMDYVGLITLIIGVGCLQVVLDLGNDEDWFNSTMIVVLSAISVVALAIFAIWEFTDKDPIVNLRLFRHRNFRSGTMALIVAYAGFFAVSLLIPQWLQRDMGYTAIWAGLATAPIGILPVIMTPFVGKYASRFDLRLLASISFVVMAITSFMRSDFNLRISFESVAGVQLLMGIGVALFFMPVLQILLSDLDGREIAAGSGLATFLRTLGGSFAASLTTYLWAKRTQLHHAHMTEHISAYSPSTQEQIQAMGGGSLQNGAALLNNSINHQASQMGFNDICYLLGWAFLAIIFLVWLAKPPFGGGGGAAAGGH
ncbi:DHA2 family efflux MFS transporter permease subunit [Xanthomonas albilineans]|uniref:DHA2 family efflux MFS transporter permease subunit n=1 Tax=Xanthomonas albilineans TaxID=29447 RepID=UPI0005F34066|nr:DHA2 family efflux MFS transporter permease subunit [Xanthomonas albilineans]